MPAHKEEQQNKLELCENAIVMDMEKKIKNNTDLTLKSVPTRFEQVWAKFPKGKWYLFVPILCQVQCPLAYTFV